MTFQEFRDKYTGSIYKYQTGLGGQCMDLYRGYVKEVLNYPQSPAVRGANNVWDTYLPDYYNRVDNTPSGVPSAGDIIIWGDSVGTYGHIAICVSGTSRSFTSFDQNWPVGAKCSLVNHKYTGVLGWLHPKVETVSLLDLLKSEGIDTEGELREVLGHHKDFPLLQLDKENAAKRIAELETRNRELESLLGDLRLDLSAAQTSEKQLREDYQNFLNTLIDKLKPLNGGDDEAAIYGELDRLMSTEDNCESVKEELKAAYSRINDLEKLVADKPQIPVEQLPSLLQIIKLLLFKKTRG